MQKSGFERRKNIIGCNIFSSSKPVIMKGILNIVYDPYDIDIKWMEW